MRHSKSTMLLAELMIAILFFSLSAAIAVGVLAGAYGESRDATDGARALLLAQEFAEEIASTGDLDALLAQCAPGVERDGLRLLALCERAQTEAGALYKVTLQVFRGEELILELPASRYLPDGEAQA